ncbi:hypothetical protein NQT69_09075 [Pseudoalteromonas shioyasakiensis]|uniref:hypothetical protein n=1 Tax=Pseudoalteromonas shioyasakiensis TaxID=1190813 RepID=UPI002118F918|nr:hypothetical protein [Pseudoalteromonas shioyasakiensis]MCQ8878147.1 hypothetical protein [Pseudoalteromonas shioyasakiensis]
MDACITRLSQQLQQHQLQSVVDDFAKLTSQQQTLQLLHLYQSAQRMDVKYSYLQNVATRILTHQPLPQLLIKQFNDTDILSFFTPGLKFNNGFALLDEANNNVIHTLFSHCNIAKLPFNYVRSLMLFESNENLLLALTQQNNQGLTPVASYITCNQYQQSLPKHEFSALLALMEAELKQNKTINTAAFLKALLTLQSTLADKTINEYTILLASAYLGCKTEQIENYLT